MTWLRIESDIRQERDAQDAKWGQQNHPNGTGEDTRLPVARKFVADQARIRCQEAFRDGYGTWEHVLTEEICEAFAEEDPEKLRVELIQCAAVIVAWVECIDRRRDDSRASHPSAFTDDDALRAAGRLFPTEGVAAGATFPGEVTDS